jgi:hypothetical protein
MGSPCAENSTRGKQRATQHNYRLLGATLQSMNNQDQGKAGRSARNAADVPAFFGTQILPVKVAQHLRKTGFASFGTRQRNNRAHAVGDPILF